MKMWRRPDAPGELNLQPKEEIEEKIASFFLRHPDYFAKSVSRFFPLSAALRTKYIERFDPVRLGQNPTQWQFLPEQLQQIMSAFNLTMDAPDDLESNETTKYEEQVRSLQFENGVPLLDDGFISHFISISFDSLELNGYRQAFSSNIEFTWSQDFIFELAANGLIDWPSLSTNPALPWEIDLIDDYLEKWWWGSLGMEPQAYVESYRKGLVDNTGIPWNIDWLIRYEDFVDFEFLPDNQNIWDQVFSPFVDEKMVDMVFRLI